MTLLIAGHETTAAMLTWVGELKRAERRFFFLLNVFFFLNVVFSLGGG